MWHHDTHSPYPGMYLKLICVIVLHQYSYSGPYFLAIVMFLLLWHFAACGMQPVTLELKEPCRYPMALFPTLTLYSDVSATNVVTNVAALNMPLLCFSYSLCLCLNLLQDKQFLGIFFPFLMMVSLLALGAWMWQSDCSCRLCVIDEFACISLSNISMKETIASCWATNRLSLTHLCHAHMLLDWFLIALQHYSGKVV